MTETMEAIRITGPGTPDDLRVSTVPLPPLQPGWARIRVRAFGINESEATSLAGGSSPDFTYPRILGIEAAGTIDAVDDGSRFAPGEQVMTMMGGMGRSFDGSYAQYVTVPEEQLIPFYSDLPWSVLGTIPEMFQTAHGSLTTGLDIRSGQSLLVRGGTSTVGLSAIALAHDRGATVLATTRDTARSDLLREHGARHVFIDDGHLAASVKELHSEGIDAALELVGLDTLPDTLRCIRRGGVACFTGALSGQWTMDGFSPLAMIPTGVRLTAYAGEASDLPAEALARMLDAITAGRIHPAVAAVHRGLERVADAHRALSASKIPGKHVVVLDATA